MPTTTQAVTLSGTTGFDKQALVYITYDRPYFPYRENKDGAKDYVPGFIFLGGRVRHRQDNQGNLISENY